MATQQRAEATRQHILDAAAECFAQYGYDAVGVAEICKRANVTKGAFYHHFPGKQALFIELLERWLAGLDVRLEEIRRTATTVPDAIRDMARGAEQLFGSAHGQVPMFLEFWSKASRDPVIWQATIAPYRRYHAYIAALIQAGIAEGSLRPVNPDTMAQLLLSLAVGLLLQGLLDPKGADWGQVAQASLQILLAGVAKKE